MFVEDVNKLKQNFTDRVNDIYNKEHFFIEPCKKFKSLLSIDDMVMDISLNIFLLENNKVVIDGKMIKYVDKNNMRKIKLTRISLDMPSREADNYVINNITNVNNITVQDQWDEIKW